MLVHICCSVDSHFFLQRLQKEYPEEPLTGFFYDPNIHPYSEYRLRLLDVQRSCRKLGIPLIEGEYDFAHWMQLVRGLEREPEKGARCEICFDRRFEVSAHKAKELGEERVTTTLLVSPQKSQEQLKRTGERLKEELGVEFVALDYRTGGGTQEQSRVSKEERLYRQDYCGCLHGLNVQRAQQEQLPDELFSPLNGSVLPGSIEERLLLYTQRMQLEDAGLAYAIRRQKYLNYRLLYGWVKVRKQIVPSYILPYSSMKRPYAGGRIEAVDDGIGYFNREEIRMMTLERFNALGGYAYETIQELLYRPPAYDAVLNIRGKMGSGVWDLSPLIVLESLPQAKIEVLIRAETYPDVREILVTL